MLRRLVRRQLPQDRAQPDPYSKARDFMLKPARYRTIAVFDPATRIWRDYR